MISMKININVQFQTLFYINQIKKLIISINNINTIKNHVNKTLFMNKIIYSKLQLYNPKRVQLHFIWIKTIKNYI